MLYTGAFLKQYNNLTHVSHFGTFVRSCVYVHRRRRDTHVLTHCQKGHDLRTSHVTSGVLASVAPLELAARLATALGRICVVPRTRNIIHSHTPHQHPEQTVRCGGNAALRFELGCQFDARTYAIHDRPTERPAWPPCASSKHVRLHRKYLNRAASSDPFESDTHTHTVLSACCNCIIHHSRLERGLWRT